NYVAQGPVLALVDASPAFEGYKGGIFNGPCSSGTTPTRAVLIVGYTSSYWIVKNSQGASWGAGGYIFLARGTNLCGISNFAIAVSNDPLPRAFAGGAPVPAASPWTIAALLLGCAAIGFAALRRRHSRAGTAIVRDRARPTRT